MDTTDETEPTKKKGGTGPASARSLSFYPRAAPSLRTPCLLPRNFGSILFLLVTCSPSIELRRLTQKKRTDGLFFFLLSPVIYLGSSYRQLYTKKKVTYSWLFFSTKKKEEGVGGCLITWGVIFLGGSLSPTFLTHTKFLVFFLLLLLLFRIFCLSFFFSCFSLSLY